MDTLRLYELLRKVQKHLGDLGACSPRKYLENFTASQFGSEAILYCRVHHFYGKLAYSEHTTLVILWSIHTYCTIQFQGLIRDRER